VFSQQQVLISYLHRQGEFAFHPLDHIGVVSHSQVRKSCRTIQSSLIVENTISPTEIQVDEQGNVFWVELRPFESGRNVLRSSQQKEDLIPKPFNCRTRVHEYGGGSYTVKNGQIYFTNFADQQIYLVDLKEKSALFIFTIR
jgi:hypothetical protein